MSEPSRRGRLGGLLALAFLLAVTAAWWALALWPVAEQPPTWLLRARAVCFQVRGNGLPDASGWLLLVGQPVGMLAALMVVWGRPVRAGLRALAGSPSGRVALAAGVAAIALGLGAAAVRVLSAPPGATLAASGDELPPDTYPRLDRPAPALGLVDQSGRRVDVEQLRGRPALVTFAFGHCETVCPAIVQQTLEVRERVRLRAASGELEPWSVPQVVVVTLDPWRDTPSRLPHIAEHWKVPEDAFVLSGAVDEVNGVLDDWNVARTRDPQTGEVVHAPLVYVLDASGAIAYATGGGVAATAELLERSLRPAATGAASPRDPAARALRPSA